MKVTITPSDKGTELTLDKITTIIDDNNDNIQ